MRTGLQDAILCIKRIIPCTIKKNTDGNNNARDRLTLTNNSFLRNIDIGNMLTRTGFPCIELTHASSLPVAESPVPRISMFNFPGMAV